MTTPLKGNTPATTYTQLLYVEPAPAGGTRNVRRDDGAGGQTVTPLHIDQTNGRIGVMNAAPAVELDVTGDVRASTALRGGGSVASGLIEALSAKGAGFTVALFSNGAYSNSSVFVIGGGDAALGGLGTAWTGISINGSSAGMGGSSILARTKYDATAGYLVGHTGTAILTWTAGGGVQIGAPTGGDKGAGALNVAADLYKNNTAYTNPDYVLEKWANGHIIRYADNPGALNYQPVTLHEVERFARYNLRLPRIPDRPAGLFERSDIILEKLEEVFIHLFDHDHRLAALEEAAHAAH